MNRFGMQARKRIPKEPKLFGCLDCKLKNCNIDIAKDCLNNNYKYKK